ncbi:MULTISPECIES: hypothetical protein [Pseudanabaena]|uniref:Uncharacterized protein n=2 Tax=Pseudanabaena TaxID=1152 RepID=L8MT20_9CYAN|nr:MULTISPECIES: hypothetical protein [Pseudanabaena]ELS31087.1 hypothetical protein Pse7429DRAFT_3340 [Pseudanabaena biceps PCC 7429]MDG3496654.1 hypothetical protein [Pseudanabaena catenata USMAC16]
MNLPNNQYSSSKFSPTKKHNPCPICDDTKGKCRIVADDQDFILCMTHPTDVGLPDWRYLGETSGGYYAGKYVRKRQESEAERTQRQLLNLQSRPAKQKAMREGWAVLPDASQRDQLYRSYLQSLTLDDVDRDDLRRRGLSVLEIASLGAKSVKSGYIVPIANPSRQILGFQVRLRDGRLGRYRWHKPLGIAAQQQNGELPLAVYGAVMGDGQVAHRRVLLVEGTGVKPFLAARLRGCPAIGASGGQFMASKLTLASYLAELGAKPGLTVLEYAVDAGDVANASVMRRHEKNLDFLDALGYELSVLWWGQVAKTDRDIDELVDGSTIQLLSVEQFFQVANYLPKPSYAPFSWLQEKLFPKPKAQGFSLGADRLIDSQALEVQESSFQGAIAPALTYAAGRRLEAWGEAVAHHRYVLDVSPTGTGKSYDAGRLRPSLMDGVERIIYISTDSRNVSTPSLQDWTLLPARHHGLTDKSGKLRRANRGDAVASLTTLSNCSRTSAFTALRDKAIADSQVICKSCPLLHACQNSQGDGFGFKYERSLAFEHKILRSHPLSLPSPDEFDYSTTLLIWEEVSESLTTMRQVSVSRDDIDRAIALLSRSDFIHRHQVIDVLNKLYGLLGDRSFHGLDFHQIKSAIPDLIDTSDLAPLLQPDLSALNTVDGVADSEFVGLSSQQKRELARVNALLKRSTTMPPHELEQKIVRDVLKQWLVEFLDILSGALTHGDLHIQYEKLTVSFADSRLRDIARHARNNLFLDATIDLQDLELRLQDSVFSMSMAGSLAMPEIFQVNDLGRLGMQRSQDQNRRVKAIVDHLSLADPSTKVIDFKRFAMDDQGVWFRDSRGSNDFKNAKTFVIIGTPCANIAVLRAMFVSLTGLHPRDGDPAFRAFVHRHIFATVLQCLGRKAGDRFSAGDKIYFLSNFNLAYIPHSFLSSGDISPLAMSKRDSVKKQIFDAINLAGSQGLDLLSLSQRNLADWLNISWGQFRRSLRWIDSLLASLYNISIQNFNERSEILTDLPNLTQDLSLISLWSDKIEQIFKNSSLVRSNLLGIIQLFNDLIPRSFHSYVVANLSNSSRMRLFSLLAMFAISC